MIERGDVSSPETRFRLPAKSMIVVTPPEGRRQAGRLWRLGHDFGSSGPVLGHWDANMRVRLDATREDDLALRLDDAPGVGQQSARPGHCHDLAVLDADVALSHIFWGHDQAASDNYVQHGAPPRCMGSCLSMSWVL